MYKTTFEHGPFTICAQCTDVNDFQEAFNMTLKFYDEDGHEHLASIDDVLDVEEIAQEKLYERKYQEELNF